LVLTEHDRADGVLLKVQRKSGAAAGELQHFAVLDVGETVDAHDTVRDGDHRADVALFGCARELLDARLDQIADFRCLDGHCHNPRSNVSESDRRLWAVGCSQKRCGTLLNYSLEPTAYSLIQCVIAPASRSRRALSEPSITKSPARTIAPPMSEGSTSQCKRTSRCKRFLSAAEKRCCCASLNCTAEMMRTSATFSTSA